MNKYADMLSSARFYGAKSEAIDNVTVLASTAFDGHRHDILAVEHGGVTDLYQVLVDSSGADALADTGAIPYVEALVNGDIGQVHGELPVGTPITPISGEQSNTSLVAGDVMVKAFRKLEPGLNPDVELLSKIADCPNVAAVHGWVSTTINGQEYTLAMVQDLVVGGQDGWELALNFAAEGRSFANEARLLGAAVRRVHDALAKSFGTTSINASAALGAHLDEMADRNLDVANAAPQARELYATLPAESVPAQRIHGDLHLGQVLRTASDYVLIDFEGEPARPLEQRRLPDSPLRDVAGLLRSIDYAANYSENTPEDWQDEASAALLEGYGITSSPLLDAYVLDKALYEVMYEADNRPEWVYLPLTAVQRIIS